MTMYENTIRMGGGGRRQDEGFDLFETPVKLQSPPLISFGDTYKLIMHYYICKVLSWLHSDPGTNLTPGLHNYYLNYDHEFNET